MRIRWAVLLLAVAVLGGFGGYELAGLKGVAQARSCTVLVNGSNAMVTYQGFSCAGFQAGSGSALSSGIDVVTVVAIGHPDLTEPVICRGVTGYYHHDFVVRDTPTDSAGPALCAQLAAGTLPHYENPETPPNR